MQEYDVTIVGGGLAGASLAVALRNHPSHRVVLIEALTEPGLQRNVFDERSIALADVSRRIFETLGLWESLAPAAYPVREIDVSEKGVFGKTRICAQNEGMDALAWVVPHRVLGNALHSKLDGVKRVSPATATRIERHADYVTVYFDQAGKSGEFRTRLLVLADAGSELGATAGFDVSASDYEQVAMVANIATDTDAGYVAYERFTPHGPLAILPLGGKRRGVVWTWEKREAQAVAAWSDERFVEALQVDAGYRLGKILSVGKRLVFPLRLSYISQMAKGRVAVIGNAAHTLHPVAGQNFNLALRDIATLAQTLFRSDDTGSPDILAAWQSVRNADVRRVVRFTDFLARAFMQRWRVLAPLRGAMLMGFELLPPLRRAVVRRSLGLSPPMSRLASGLALTPQRRVHDN